MLQVFVGNQPILVEEGGHTFFAQVTFYSSVNFLVALKAGIAIKFFQANFTGMFFLFFMMTSLDMRLYVTRTICFAALFTRYFKMHLVLPVENF